MSDTEFHNHMHFQYKQGIVSEQKKVCIMGKFRLW